MSKKDFNIEGTQDRFFIDFGSPSRAAAPLKIVFSYHSGIDFIIFGLLNMKSNLSHQKHRFWLRFGGQLGVQNLQVASKRPLEAEEDKFLGIPRDIKKTSIFLLNFDLPDSGVGGTGANLWD